MRDTVNLENINNTEFIIINKRNQLPEYRMNTEQQNYRIEETEDGEIMDIADHSTQPERQIDPQTGNGNNKCNSNKKRPSELGDTVEAMEDNDKQTNDQPNTDMTEISMVVMTDTDDSNNEIQQQRNDNQHNMTTTEQNNTTFTWTNLEAVLTVIMEYNPSPIPCELIASKLPKEYNIPNDIEATMDKHRKTWVMPDSTARTIFQEWTVRKQLNLAMEFRSSTASNGVPFLDYISITLK